MKLSELVDLKIRIEKYSSHVKHLNKNTFLSEINSWSDLSLQNDSFLKLHEEIKSADNLIQAYFSNCLEEIEKEIENQSAILLTYGFTLNGVVQLGPTQNAQDELNYRSTKIPLDLAETIGSIIRRYTDWKIPTLEIGPGDGFWTNNLVGSDPLYLVDIHDENLKKTIHKYNRLFARKIRSYLIGAENNKSHLDLSNLPENQIGFIFSWGVFDYLFVNEIEIYLEQCLKILRPGGTMIFSYNNCDTVKGAQLAETGQKAWLTEKILSRIVSKNNMELVKIFVANEDFTYAEIKKPGTIKSIKVDQPQLSIKIRPGLEKVDTETKINYNKQQIARIKQLAIQLGIDNEHAIMANQYDPHKLMHLIEVARINKK
jgi:SAM-dependent methyltransferase